MVSFRDIIDSDYNLRHCRGAERRAYETLDGLILEIENAVKSGPERKFVYAYWPEYDALSHRYGSESAEALAQFEKIDQAYASLLARLAGTDSLVIATADHGFVDVEPEFSLELPPFLASQLKLPLCGERRVAYCHVHSKNDFLEKRQDNGWETARTCCQPGAGGRRLVRARQAARALRTSGIGGRGLV